MNWTCPICRCTRYRITSVERPDGSTYKTEFHQCAGCTVMFREPALFNAEAIAAQPRLPEDSTLAWESAQFNQRLDVRYVRARLSRLAGGTPPEQVSVDLVEAAIRKGL